MTSHDQILSQTVAARKQAEELLSALLSVHASGQADQTGRDLFRKVTGSSSLDNAISQTRRTIETFDRVLVDLRGGPSPDAATPATAAAKWQATPVTVVFGEAARAM